VVGGCGGGPGSRRVGCSCSKLVKVWFLRNTGTTKINADDNFMQLCHGCEAVSMEKIGGLWLIVGFKP
jgi:hypothetical protein